MSAAAALQSMRRPTHRRSGRASSATTTNTLIDSSTSRAQAGSGHARSAAQHASAQPIVNMTAMPAARSSACRRRSTT
jgi:hypothetical protein